MAAKKEFYIRIKDELVEVTQEVYLTYYRGKRGEETQLEKICRNHVVSYDAFDTESALGAEMLIDTASDEPEDIVIARLMAEKLHDSISKLSEDERQLILRRSQRTGNGQKTRHSAHDIAQQEGCSFGKTAEISENLKKVWCNRVSNTDKG